MTVLAGGASANINPNPKSEADFNGTTAPRKPTGGGHLNVCGLFPAGHAYSCKALAAMERIKACHEFPKGHAYSCENLAAMDLLMACNKFPKGHPNSCEKLAALDRIKACNQFPQDHPYGCKAIVSGVVKKPAGIFRDEEGRLRSVADFGVVRTAGVAFPKN